jgi:hypothetical protein
MTERQQFERKEVYLWGTKQAKKSLLNEFDKGDQNPNRRVRQPRQQQAQAPPRVREFEVGEDYGVQDLPFLNREYERIDNLMNGLQDMDLMDELMDKQDRLYELIEGLENLKRMTGHGVIKEQFLNDDLDGDDFIVMQLKGMGFKKGSPEAIAHAEKMRKALEAKKGIKTEVKEVKKSITSKARVEKGSEEAKAIGKRLAEAKKKKLEEAKKLKEEEEAKQPKPREKLKGKPYYYIGDIPQGYREATMMEAIKNNKVSEYGKYPVDLDMYSYFRDYGVLLNENADDNEIRVMLSVLKKKTIRELEDIEIYNNKLDNPKYEDKKEEFKNKLNTAKDRRKVFNGMYNFYWKLWCERHDIEYKRVKIERPKAKELKYEPTDISEWKPPERPIDPRTGKPIPIKDEIKKDAEYQFTRGDGVEIGLKRIYFDDNKKLKSKYAKQLFKKNIFLSEKFYQPEDVKKYFFTN